MRMRYFFLLLALSCPFQGLFAQTESTNGGFVSSVIWYSKDPFAAHEKIRVYTLVFNGHDDTLRGTVVFKNTGTPIGEYSFSVNGNAAKDISIPWTPEAGKHSLVAHIENAELISRDGTARKITLKSSETPPSERIVENRIAYTQTPPAKLIQSLESTPVVTLLETLLQAGVSRAISLLPEPIEESAVNTIEMIEEKRETALVGLQTRAADNKTTPSFESLKNSPFDTTALFAATISASVLNSPLFTYVTALLLVLFLVGRFRRWYRGF